MVYKVQGWSAKTKISLIFFEEEAKKLGKISKEMSCWGQKWSKNYMLGQN